MTKQMDRQGRNGEPSVDDPVSPAMRGSRNSRDELDAEIVRDLEVDQAADDVRGGPCGGSQTHPTQL